MSKRMLCLAAPIMLLAGCSASEDSAAGGTGGASADDALAAIAAAEEAQQAAFNADDLDAATAVYTDDARFFDAGSAPVVGAEAIRAAFEGMMADANNAIELTRVSAWVANSGELAVTVSDYTLTYSGKDGEAQTVSGSNQTVWALQEDGSWKIASDHNGPTGDGEASGEASGAAEAPAAADGGNATGK